MKRVWVILTSVIIIDDDVDIVSVMSELLEMNGMDVIGKGYNGLEGVQLFDELHPDVILLDLIMPQYDGLYALRKIREKDPTANVIIISGGAPASFIEKIQFFKPTKILAKPIDVNILIESFLVESNSLLPFKIRYKFKENKKFYTCILTYEQFKNFKELPIVQECKVLKKDQKNIKEYKDEMQEALNLAAKNDITHIRKLSEVTT